SGLIVQLPLDSKISYHYLLGLLNSKLIDFLYHDLVPEENRIFPEVKPVQLFKLPICIQESKIQLEIEKKVLKIIEMKEKNIGNDSSEIETQIDELIYQLYGLTQDEISIIEKEKKQ
ncbi:MAG TPA: restriction endonuclease, partial [Bacteroidales bacterium]|nr:restriction endonuclease [Bacteroidales bacterium]